MELKQECWIYNNLCNGFERNQNGLERTIYVPILTVLLVFLIIIGVMVLKEIQDPPLLPYDSCIKLKWLYFAGD